MRSLGSESGRFELGLPGRVLFGAGVSLEAGRIVRPLGRTALLVTGANPSRCSNVRAALESEGLSIASFEVKGEPTLDTIRAGSEALRRSGADCVVAVGGGSVLDAGKAIAALAGALRGVEDYLEVVGKGLPLDGPGCACVAIPTTAGTGAEVTRNAVLGVPSHRVKVSLRGPLVLPRVALVDPLLTVGLPREWTVATGMDALTQLIEPMVSVRANPMVDSWCREGLSRVTRSFSSLCSGVEDVDLRADMSYASLLGGLSLANAGLGAVHGLAGPIGGYFSDAPHGAVCAALLPVVMRVNLRALRVREPGHARVAGFTDLACVLTGRADACAEDGVAWVEALCGELGVPGLRRMGVQEQSFEALARQASKANSMKSNPLVLTHEELLEILEGAY